MAMNPDSTLSSESMDDTLNQVGKSAGPAVDRLREGMSSARETVMEGLEDFGELQERWTENCRGCVREHPLSSLAIGILAGILLGRLLIR